MGEAAGLPRAVAVWRRSRWRAGDARARLAYGWRLLPAAVLLPVWALWGLGLAAFVTAPAWLGRVPGALDTYRLLDRWAGLPAAVSAAVVAGVDPEGDPTGLLHALPAAGMRLWLDRLALAGGAVLLADGCALAAARAYLPLPWGPALGTLVGPSALLTALGFWGGSLWGAWGGEGATLLLWVLAARRLLLRGPLWRLDPFLATQPALPQVAPAETLTRLLANRWLLAAAAAGLGALSALARAHPDRPGAWVRCIRPRLPGGLRAAPTAVLGVAALAAALVWWGARPVLERVPARPLAPSGTVAVSGTARVTVTDAGGRWSAVLAAPVTLPALGTSLYLTAPGATEVAARLGRTPLLAAPDSTGWLLSARALGWSAGRSRTLRLTLSLSPPLPGPGWPGLNLGGAPLGVLRLRWPAAAPVEPEGAVVCGDSLCWSGPAAQLVLGETSGRGGSGA